MMNWFAVDKNSIKVEENGVKCSRHGSQYNTPAKRVVLSAPNPRNSPPDDKRFNALLCAATSARICAAGICLTSHKPRYQFSDQFGLNGAIAVHQMHGIHENDATNFAAIEAQTRRDKGTYTSPFSFVIVVCRCGGRRSGCWPRHPAASESDGVSLSPATRDPD